MRFLVDECLSLTLVAELRKGGHDVHFTREGIRGQSDQDILAIAHEAGRIVITEDADFGLLVLRERRPAVGLPLVAASAFDWPQPLLAAHVLTVIECFGEQLIGSFTKIEPGRIRQRKLKQD